MNARRFMIILNSNLLLNSIATVGASGIYRLQPIGAYAGRMQIGVISSTFLTLLIPLTQTGTQLLIIRLLTGFGLGFAVSAPFPIAAELMPAQHRRTFGAIFEVMLASAFTLLPFVGFVLAGNPEGFRLIALPGGLALGVVPLLVHLGLPESPRWQSALHTLIR
jgi:MFS family permease